MPEQIVVPGFFLFLEQVSHLLFHLIFLKRPPSLLCWHIWYAPLNCTTAPPAQPAIQSHPSRTPTTCLSQRWNSNTNLSRCSGTLSPPKTPQTPKNPLKSTLFWTQVKIRLSCSMGQCWNTKPPYSWNSCPSKTHQLFQQNACCSTCAGTPPFLLSQSTFCWNSKHYCTCITNHRVVLYCYAIAKQITHTTTKNPHNPKGFNSTLAQTTRHPPWQPSQPTTHTHQSCQS